MPREYPIGLRCGWGGDTGRVFDLLANDKVIATEELKNEKPGEFIAKHDPLPKEVLETAPDGGA